MFFLSQRADSGGMACCALGDSVHPIDNSGRAVLMRLYGQHFSPKRCLQSQLLLETFIIHGSKVEQLFQPTRTTR